MFEGIYFLNNEYKIAWYIDVIENQVTITTIPRITRSDKGTYYKNKSEIIFKRFGKVKIKNNELLFKNFILHRDKRINKIKNQNKYLTVCNAKYNTNFIGLNYLVTDDNKEYKFNINNCSGAS